MKKTLIAFAAMALLSSAAIARTNTPPPQQGSESSAIAGAAAGAASQSIAGATGGDGGNARVDSTNLNSLSNRTEVNTNLGQAQQATSSSGGNTMSNAGNNAAQSSSTNVTVQGDVTESNTPPVVAGVLPSVPTSCRLYLFGGGATRDGTASGTLPIGNDQTCLSIAKLNLMERAGGFTQAEKQAVVCKVEGMDDLGTCKAVAK